MKSKTSVALYVMTTPFRHLGRYASTRERLPLRPLSPQRMCQAMRPAQLTMRATTTSSLTCSGAGMQNAPGRLLPSWTEHGQLHNQVLVIQNQIVNTDIVGCFCNP
jgi:hypothetical protein